MEVVHHSAEVTGAEAQDFLEQLRTEWGDRGCTAARLAQVRAEIAATGTYQHTEQELTRGCKIAWRNTPRCLGKFYWNALAVRDMRHLSTTGEVFDALVEQLKEAANGGRIRLLMTVCQRSRYWALDQFLGAGCRE